MIKKSFDIDLAINHIRTAVEPLPKAALFELYAEGYTSPFELLAACIISIRTFDEVMLPTARRLFARARTPEAVRRLTLAELREGIPGSPFYGPKGANLVLGVACGQARIGVDIHVHRITNRWGYVKASTPEKTMVALEAKLPEPYWVEINRLLVPFGKHICTGQRPRCSTCPGVEMCQQIGVTAPPPNEHRGS